MRVVDFSMRLILHDFSRWGRARDSFKMIPATCGSTLGDVDFKPNGSLSTINDIITLDKKYLMAAAAAAVAAWIWLWHWRYAWHFSDGFAMLPRC